MTDLYRKRPLPVEARQLLGSEDGQTGRDLADWCGGSVAGTFTEPKVWVPTLEGGLTARVGDWIVKGPRDEFWPVKGSIFAETYEDADTPLHAGCRTDALTEGARLLEDAACDADWDRAAEYCQGLRAGAELLLAKTTGKGGVGLPTATTEWGVRLPDRGEYVAAKSTEQAAREDAASMREDGINATVAFRTAHYGTWTDVTEAGGS